MRLLLDTHALVCWLTDSPSLSRRARDAIANPATEPWVSAVTGYELAYKRSLGKLASPLADELIVLVRQTGFRVLAISLNHAVEAGRLPGPHRDPWDRLLMAQAQQERLTLATKDPVFASYGLATLW